MIEKVHLSEVKLVKKTYIKTTLVAILLVAIFTSLLLLPSDVVAASKRGLDIWWTIVFPTLLPFLIINELLRSYGVVDALGHILDPIMRPLFKVSGSGGYALAIGMTSGMPVGAKITTQLRIDNLVTRTEAERLVAFTNFANPLFIFGAVAIGFYGIPQIGVPLAIAHYSSGILTGFLMRFYKNNERTHRSKASHSLLKRAYYTMHKKRISETRPFGKIFSDAVQVSIQTLLMIGGFIIIFSVLNSVLSKLLTFDLSSTSAFIAGIIEMSLGSQLLGSSNVQLLPILLLQSFVLGFGGLSIHSQILAIISESDIRYFPFFIAKLLHGFISVVMMFLIFNFFDISVTTSFSFVNFQFPIKIGPLITLVTIGLCVFIYFGNLFRKLLNKRVSNVRRY